MHQIQEEIGIPKIEKEELGLHHAIFSIGPLPKGYGMTLGNALRRVLLSSLPGAAVMGMKIKGVFHEYSTIKGAKDSILDIGLNLKMLHMKKTTKESSILTLKISNREGIVYAKDIKTPSGVEILNPDLYITTMDNKNAKLDMEIFVEKGVGYLPASLRKQTNEDTSMILIDAIFSPLERIRYDVEATRVGQMTDLDKLIIEIQTNGSISPENTLKFASNILKSYFNIFDQSQVPVEAEFMSDFSKIAQKQIQEEQSKPKPKSYTPIEILGLSPRTLNALLNGGIGSIEELVECTEGKLINLRGFGKKAFQEVKVAIKQRNLELKNSDPNKTAQ